MQNNISTVKKTKTRKMKQSTKEGLRELKGFVIGLLIGCLGVLSWHKDKISDLKVQYLLSNPSINTNSSNLLYENSAIKSLLINSLPEVHIADDIQQNNDNNSNLASTTIKVANNKNKESFIPDTISRAEVREDGNLIKIIGVNDIIDSNSDILKPNSIESFIINFPISSNAKELTIEVFSNLASTPISTKTFNLSSNES